MSSSRKTRPIEPALPGPDVNALTAQVRAQLKHYISHAALVNNSLKDVNQIQTELDVEGKPINLVKGRLDRAYDTVGAQASDEIQRIDATIETIDLLLKHPATIAASQQPSTSSVSTPTATGNKRGPYKKRQKTDAGSQAGSPVASRAGSPANSHATSPGATPVGPSSSSTTVPGGGGGNVNNKTSGGGKFGKSTAKSRRDAITAQLPLTPGRQVAFRQPIKGNNAGSNNDVKDDWILAVVIASLDKNRYTVQDIDFDPTNPTPDGGKYNTTLKSLIPLPDRRFSTSYPDFDFQSGTNVLALYPETTSFYRAVVQSGPAPLTSLPKKSKDKDKYYKVKFEDDNDNVQEVAQELVVEVP
ncbi:hypothetical protein OIO90_001682 [Microbotryomycetes sp. JL221]|nr:hypothetical protein OIO90_001682 [Microbotryomycetes sp. JL221]